MDVSNAKFELTNPPRWVGTGHLLIEAVVLLGIAAALLHLV